MKCDFVALDVETANPDLASICQIGIVNFQDDCVLNKWETFLNPEDDFDSMNISIHGITREMVKYSPTFPQIIDLLQEKLSGNIVVTHTAFDKSAINRASEKYKMPILICKWLDTARISRRAWSQFGFEGYGLANVANKLGIEFIHHNAAEDARAAGEILIRAMLQTGLSIDDWFKRIEQPIIPGTNNFRRAGNLEGPLAGEHLVFTGALTIPRREAADIAAKAGCDVGNNVNQETTILVVGDQDIRKMAGQSKSTKHRKAEELIKKGQSIRIIQESDFIYITKE